MKRNARRYACVSPGVMYDELLVLIVVVRTVNVLEVVVVVHMGQFPIDDRGRMRKFLYPFENAPQRSILLQTLDQHFHHLLSVESYSTQGILEADGILFKR